MGLGLGTGLSTKSLRGKLGPGPDENLGPELAGAFPGSYTTSGTGITVDGSGAHFVAATNIAHFNKTTAGTEDNATYKVVFTVANFTSSNGGAQAMIYGPTTAHLGPGTVRTANGTYTEYLTTSAAGTVLNTVRIRATGTSGNNNFDITSFSVRKVL